MAEEYCIYKDIWGGEKIEYEYVSRKRKVIDYLLLPGISLSEKVTNLFIRKSGRATKIKEKATSAEALELVYTFNSGKAKRSLDNCLTGFWMHLRNSKAVRNRLLLVKHILSKILMSSESNQEVLSLGSGSARAVIEVMSNLKNRIRVRSTLVDNNKDAIILSKKIANNLGVFGAIEYVNESIKNFLLKSNKSFSCMVVEMVGILDYFDDDEAEEVLSLIYKRLPKDGFLITANIADNPERKFMTKVVKWNMIYRDKETLHRIIRVSGFKDIDILTEPIMIHNIAVAKK